MIQKIFLNHPRSVNETYVEHFFFAARFATLLGVACLMATVHALVPCLFEKSASKIIMQLHDRLVVRS